MNQCSATHGSISVAKWDKNYAVQFSTNHAVACQIKLRILGLSNRRGQSNFGIVSC